MKKHLSVFSLFTVMICCAALLCGCKTAEPRITQVAIIDTLLGGMYDGSATVGQLKSWGNIGIGTMHQLDGEMLVRRVLSSTKGQDMPEQIISLMGKTSTNADFFEKMKGWIAVFEKDGFSLGGKA